MGVACGGGCGLRRWMCREMEDVHEVGVACGGGCGLRKWVCHEMEEVGVS